MLHCLEASLYSHFHSVARSLCLLPCCPGDILCWSSATGSRRLSQPTEPEAGQQVALQVAEQLKACLQSEQLQGCRTFSQALAKLTWPFPCVCSLCLWPWLGCCCGEEGGPERMMKLHKNILILLLERVGKARGERKEEGDKERGPPTSPDTHLAFLLH